MRFDPARAEDNWGNFPVHLAEHAPHAHQVSERRRKSGTGNPPSAELAAGLRRLMRSIHLLNRQRKRKLPLDRLHQFAQRALTEVLPLAKTRPSFDEIVVVLVSDR